MLRDFVDIVEHSDRPFAAILTSWPPFLQTASRQGVSFKLCLLPSANISRGRLLSDPCCDTSYTYVFSSSYSCGGCDSVLLRVVSHRKRQSDEMWM